jgi:hypothetical protein
VGSILIPRTCRPSLTPTTFTISLTIDCADSLCDEEEKGVSYNVPEHVADLMDEVTNINARGQ